MSEPTWQEIAKIARDHRDDSIHRVKPPVPELPDQLPLDRTDIPKYLLSTEETVITQTAPEDLVVSLASGKYTSTAVTTAFLRRAGLAQGLANCITELLPERAIARAKSLDEYLSRHGKPIGPLHGLPISVKEHIGMKDLGVNAGFASWWDHKGEDDALVLKILWKAGCVFYARTTEPQTLMHLETSNNLYGVTVNPFNSQLTSGGSSGGEGALIALRGSCLGLGTDIGGSIRSPSANCGVYGLRPSSYRIPHGGLTHTMRGSEQIVAVLGPLSTSLEGLKLFMKTVINGKPSRDVLQEQGHLVTSRALQPCPIIKVIIHMYEANCEVCKWLYEPSLVPIPWRDQQDYLGSPPRKKLKIGVIWHDGIVKPHPPVVRALQEVVNKLKKAELADIVDWNPYKHDEAWSIISSLYFCDGGQEEIAAIEASGEPWRPLSNFILKENNLVKKLTVEEIWAWTRKREEYRAEYAKLWNDTRTGINEAGELEGTVDVILCPAGPGAAPPLDCARYWGYTAQWNLLDYPAVVFPVTKVDLTIDMVDEGYVPINEQDEYNHQLWKSGPDKYKGAPVSLQLVGRRYEDEKVIEALEFIKENTGLPFANFV